MANTFCVHFFLSFLRAISRPVGRGGGKFGCWRLAVAFSCCVWRLAFGLWRLAFGVWRLTFGIWPLAVGPCMPFAFASTFAFAFALCSFRFGCMDLVFFRLSSSYFCYLLSSSFLILPFSVFIFRLLSFFLLYSSFLFLLRSSFSFVLCFSFYYPYLALTLSLTVTPNITLTITPTPTLSTPDLLNPQVQVTRDKVVHNGDFKNPVLWEGEQGRESRKSTSTG